MGEMKLFFGPNHPGLHGNFSVHMYEKVIQLLGQDPYQDFYTEDLKSSWREGFGIRTLH